MTTRRAVLCALPALPSVATAFGQSAPQRTVQVVVQGTMLYSKEFVDQLVQDIKEALNDRDVILIDKSSRPQK